VVRENPEEMGGGNDHRVLRSLLRTPNLDERVQREPERVERLRDRLREASELAWADGGRDHDTTPEVAAARLVTQRALYELNRLRFFWFDGLEAYVNERSRVAFELQDELEAPWQRWLARLVPEEERCSTDAPAALRAWAERDRRPASGSDWFAEHAGIEAYRRLLEIVSVNGLVEASQLSRVLGGPQHPVQSTLFRILMEEYGAGRPHKKHSHFFARMLEEQGLAAQPEAYLDSAPWQVLSAINQSFYLTENRRHYLRFCGAFTYTELSTPVGFRGYAAAAQRLGLSDGHGDYWALHIREDERHGAWMVDEVALPLLAQFPERAGEVLFGYAQQRVVERMAGEATEQSCREVERECEPS
jgi:hypothetical protein